MAFRITNTPEVPIGECGLVETSVELSLKVHKKVGALLEAFPHSEWFAYLKGEITRRGAYVYDIIVPSQVATGGSVDKQEYPRGLITIGTIHCHPWNNATQHSGTDETYTIQNHPLNILVSADQKYTAVFKVRLPCKRVMRVKPEVTIREVQYDLTEFVAEAKNKVQTNVNRSVVVNSISPDYDYWDGYKSQRCGSQGRMI